MHLASLGAGIVTVNHQREYEVPLSHGDIVKIGSNHLFLVYYFQNRPPPSEDDATMRISDFPTYESIIMPDIDVFVADFVRKESRHWRGADDTVRVLKAESERVSAMLANKQQKKNENENENESGEEKKSEQKINEKDDDEHNSYEDSDDDFDDALSEKFLTKTLQSYETALMDIEEFKAVHINYLTNEILELKPIISEVNEIADELEKFFEYEIALVAKGGATAAPKVAETVGNGEGVGEPSVDSLVNESKADHFDMIAASQEIMSVEELNIDQFRPFPADIWVKAKNTTQENPDELWHINKFMNRVELFRDMYSTYTALFRDLMALGRIKPPDIDPFYEPPNDSLIGVAYCFLDAISFQIEIHESVSCINFKGKVVGELDIAIFPTMSEQDTGIVKEEKDADGVAFTSEEFIIADHVGQTMNISINVKAAKGLPKRTCSGVFISFPFFLQSTPFATARCNKATVNPWFNETFGISQMITKDFIDYLSHSAIEIELWGAPESSIKSKFSSARFEESYNVGDTIEIDEKEIKSGAVEDEEDLDAAFLAEQLEDCKQELKIQKEVQSHEKILSDKRLSEAERLEKQAREEKKVSEEELAILTIEWEGKREKLEADLKKAKSGVCVVS